MPAIRPLRVDDFDPLYAVATDTAIREQHPARAVTERMCSGRSSSLSLARTPHARCLSAEVLNDRLENLSPSSATRRKEMTTICGGYRTRHPQCFFTLTPISLAPTPWSPL
jgi:hypothetical protein